MSSFVGRLCWCFEAKYTNAICLQLFWMKPLFRDHVRASCYYCKCRSVSDEGREFGVERVPALKAELLVLIASDHAFTFELFVQTPCVSALRAIVNCRWLTTVLLELGCHVFTPIMCVFFKKYVLLSSSAFCSTIISVLGNGDLHAIFPRSTCRWT